MNLSEHFTMVEAMKSSTADRKGIDNSPMDIIVPRLKRVADNVLEVVRAEFGSFSPSSWYRCLELNQEIGSKDTSQHVLGEAVDFEIVGLPNRELACWCAENLATFDQIILEFYNERLPNAGWVHVSLIEDKPNRENILTISNKGVVEGLPA